jgi:hypothetical protein
MYITQEYDFFEAITKNKNLESPKYKDFNITKVTHILDNAAIVETTHGKYWCEGFEDANANIYMKVSQYI